MIATNWSKRRLLITDKLSKSGLFTKVGISDDANNFPELIGHVKINLPSLLSASDLEQKIQPLLTPAKIREAMAQNRQSLEQLEGIGRAEMIAKDPSGFFRHYSGANVCSAAGKCCPVLFGAAAFRRWQTCADYCPYCRIGNGHDKGRPN